MNSAWNDPDRNTVALPSPPLHKYPTHNEIEAFTISRPAVYTFVNRFPPNNQLRCKRDDPDVSRRRSTQ